MPMLTAQHLTMVQYKSHSCLCIVFYGRLILYNIFIGICLYENIMGYFIFRFPAIASHHSDGSGIMVKLILQQVFYHNSSF